MCTYTNINQHRCLYRIAMMHLSLDWINAIKKWVVKQIYSLHYSVAYIKYINNTYITYKHININNYNPTCLTRFGEIRLQEALFWKWENSFYSHFPGNMYIKMYSELHFSDNFLFFSNWTKSKYKWQINLGYLRGVNQNTKGELFCLLINILASFMYFITVYCTWSFNTNP